MVVTFLLESKYLTNFSLEELTGSLLAHEARMTLDLGTLEHAFQTKVSMDKGRGKEKVFMDEVKDMVEDVLKQEINLKKQKTS